MFQTITYYAAYMTTVFLYFSDTNNRKFWYFSFNFFCFVLFRVSVARRSRAAVRVAPTEEPDQTTNRSRRILRSIRNFFLGFMTPIFYVSSALNIYHITNKSDVSGQLPCSCTSGILNKSNS